MEVKFRGFNHPDMAGVMGTDDKHEFDGIVFSYSREDNLMIVNVKQGSRVIPHWIDRSGLEQLVEWLQSKIAEM
jgi:hypothetical protein